MRNRILLLLGLFLCTCVTAQTVAGVAELNGLRIDHQRKAMLALGGWAIGNIGVGLALRGNTTGETRRFHEMNAIWNVVNLGIAGFGYWSALGEDPSALGAWGGMREDLKFQKILLFNAGLDVGYVLGGLYLRERSNRSGADRDLLRGYGNSVILQGGFLFVFDLVNFLIAHRRQEAYRLLFGATGDGVGAVWNF